MRVTKEEDFQLRNTCGSNSLCRIIPAALISAVKVFIYSAPFNLHFVVDLHFELKFPSGVIISWRSLIVLLDSSFIRPILLERSTDPQI